MKLVSQYHRLRDIFHLKRKTAKSAKCVECIKEIENQSIIARDVFQKFKKKYFFVLKSASIFII